MAATTPLLKQIAWISAVPHLTVGALLVLAAYWTGGNAGFESPVRKPPRR